MNHGCLDRRPFSIAAALLALAAFFPARAAEPPATKGVSEAERQKPDSSTSLQALNERFQALVKEKRHEEAKAVARQIVDRVANTGEVLTSEETDALEVRVYPVDDLLLDAENKDEVNKLVEMVKAQVEPASADAGGEATVDYFAPNRSLVIRQTAQGHDRLVALLQWIRKSHEARTVRTIARLRPDLEVKVYPIADLLPHGDDHTGQFIGKLVKSSFGESTPVEYSAATNSLIIGETAEGHARVDDMLTQLRRIGEAHKKSPEQFGN